MRQLSPMRGHFSTTSVSTPSWFSRAAIDEPGLGAADDEHRRLAVLIGLRLAAHVRPVVAAEIAGIGGAGRAVGADLLLVPASAPPAWSRAARRCMRRRRPRCPATGGRCRRRGPSAVSNSKIASMLSMPRRFTWRGGLRPAGRMKPVRRGPRLFRGEPGGDGVAARNRRDVPGEGQHVPPVATPPGTARRSAPRRAPPAPPRRPSAIRRRAPGLPRGLEFAPVLVRLVHRCLPAGRRARRRPSGR